MPPCLDLTTALNFTPTWFLDIEPPVGLKSYKNHNGNRSCSPCFAPSPSGTEPLAALSLVVLSCSSLPSRSQAISKACDPNLYIWMSCQPYAWWYFCHLRHFSTSGRCILLHTTSREWWRWSSCRLSNSIPPWAIQPWLLALQSQRWRHRFVFKAANIGTTESVPLDSIPPSHLGSPPITLVLEVRPQALLSGCHLSLQSLASSWLIHGNDIGPNKFKIKLASNPVSP